MSQSKKKRSPKIRRSWTRNPKTRATPSKKIYKRTSEKQTIKKTLKNLPRE